MTGSSEATLAYFRAVDEANDDLSDALAAIRAEQDEGRITAIQAADERVGLMERHLALTAQLRAKHMVPGETAPSGGE